MYVILRIFVHYKNLAEQKKSLPPHLFLFNLWHSCYPALPKCSSVRLPPCGHISQHKESPTRRVWAKMSQYTDSKWLCLWHISFTDPPPLHLSTPNLYVPASWALITKVTNLKVAINCLVAAQLLASPSTFTFISLKQQMPVVGIFWKNNNFAIMPVFNFTVKLWKLTVLLLIWSEDNSPSGLNGQNTTHLIKSFSSRVGIYLWMQRRVQQLAPNEDKSLLVHRL